MIMMALQLADTVVLIAWGIVLYRWQRRLRVWHGALVRLQKLLDRRDQLPLWQPRPPSDDQPTMH